MKTTLRGHSLVSGVSVRETGEVLNAVNPATGQKLAPDYHLLELSSVPAVTQKAQEAFEDYADRSGADKAKFLRTIADRLEEVAEDLVERMPKETALPEPRVRGETARTIGQLRMFADLIQKGSWLDARIETAQPDRQPLSKPDLRSVLRPLGPVAVFCAGNFPLAFSVAGGDTAAALAAGCPVIVKAHRSHPGVSEIVGQAVIKAAAECALPEGVFSLVYGSGKTVGDALVRLPEIKAVGFTGSRAGGQALMRTASKREKPIPVFAEMSSINPIVILPETLRQNGSDLAKGIHTSVTLGLGQFCTNPGLILVPDNEAADRLAADLTTAFADTPDGYCLGPEIAASYRRTVARFSELKPQGVSSRRLPNEADDKEPCRISAALFETNAETFLKEPKLNNEAFGPATVLIRWRDRNELLSVIRSLEGQLTGSVHGTEEELSAAKDIVKALQGKIGRLIVNGYPTGVEVCPAMVHGGPWPATSDCGRSTSVGTMAIRRFVRPFCYQSMPETLLPDALKNGNPLNLERLVNGEYTKAAL